MFQIEVTFPLISAKKLNQERGQRVKFSKNKPGKWHENNKYPVNKVEGSDEGKKVEPEP